jgi:hypothetical protein
MEHTLNNIEDWVYAHGDCLFNWDSARCTGRYGGTAISNTSGLACMFNKGVAAAERLVSPPGRLRGEIYRAGAVHSASGRQHLSARVSRGLNSPGARQAFGAPQNGPGRAASLESPIGSGRSSKNLDAC